MQLNCKLTFNEKIKKKNKEYRESLKYAESSLMDQIDRNIEALRNEFINLKLSLHEEEEKR
jgi:hypothetical protein